MDVTPHEVEIAAYLIATGQNARGRRIRRLRAAGRYLEASRALRLAVIRKIPSSPWLPRILAGTGKLRIELEPVDA